MPTASRNDRCSVPHTPSLIVACLQGFATLLTILCCLAFCSIKLLSGLRSVPMAVEMSILSRFVVSERRKSWIPTSLIELKVKLRNQTRTLLFRFLHTGESFMQCRSSIFEFIHSFANGFCLKLLTIWDFSYSSSCVCSDTTIWQGVTHHKVVRLLSCPIGISLLDMTMISADSFLW